MSGFFMDDAGELYPLTVQEFEEMVARGAHLIDISVRPKFYRVEKEPHTMGTKAFNHCRFDMLTRAAWALRQDALFAKSALNLSAAMRSWELAKEVASQALSLAQDPIEREQAEANLKLIEQGHNEAIHVAKLEKESER